MDQRLRMNNIEYLMRKIKEDYPDANMNKILNRLLLATQDEVIRFADAVERFGAKNIIDNVK